MSDVLDPVTEDVSCAPYSAKRKLPTWLVLMCVLLVCFVGAAVVLDRMTVHPSVMQDQDIQQRVVVLEQRLQSVEASLSAVGGEAGTAHKPTPTVQLELTPAPEIEQLKIGLAGLSGALGQLQTELEKSSKISNENQMNTKAGLVTVLGFMQLQRIALGGQSFEKERQDLRKVAEGDPRLVDMLIKLEPIALTGAPPASSMIKEWREKANEAQVALRKAGALTWLDRVLVALEGLVSIRTLNASAGKTLSFDIIEMDLQESNLKGALEKIIALPLEVQSYFVVVRKKIEGRIVLEESITDIYNHLMIRGEGITAPAEDSAIQQETGAK